MIDDLGYVQQSREEMEVLFPILAERYERGRVLISSYLPFSKWEAIFKDPMTTAAAIDRLVHHSAGGYGLVARVCEKFSFVNVKVYDCVALAPNSVPASIPMSQEKDESPKSCTA